MSQVVIITGSSRGIGEATAARFLANGDQVVIFCRHQNHVDEAVGRLLEFGQKENILATTGDVRSTPDVKRIVKEALDRFGRIDVLVNNAGMAIWKLVEETSEQEWDDLLDTNLKGAFLFTHQVLPMMKKQGVGVIINISSGLGVQGQARYSAYSASKFGMIGLTQVVADEVKDSKIKIYAVLPGAVATKLHLDVHPWEDPKSMMTPEYVGGKIFELAKGGKPNGYELEVYQ